AWAARPAPRGGDAAANQALRQRADRGRARPREGPARQRPRPARMAAAMPPSRVVRPGARPLREGAQPLQPDRGTTARGRRRVSDLRPPGWEQSAPAQTNTEATRRRPAIGGIITLARKKLKSVRL